MELLDRITSDPAICGGKPCIRGMRMRVLDIMQMMAGGDSVDDIVEAFPYIEREDVLACLAFAATRVEYPFVRAAAE
jgi:uncharacterized protein (DUF433 family)